MVLKRLNVLRCENCGGTNVKMYGWFNPNTNRYCRRNIEIAWCRDCDAHTDLYTLKELWERFSKVPVNNDDEIEENFLLFEAGTSKFDVWHWFDERCPNNLHDDLMHF